MSANGWTVTQADEFKRGIASARQKLRSEIQSIDKAKGAEDKWLRCEKELKKFRNFQKKIQRLESGDIEPLKLEQAIKRRSFIFKVGMSPRYRLLRHDHWTAGYRLDFEKRECIGLFVVNGKKALQDLLKTLSP